MQQKQLIAEHRCLKADYWLARQPLDRFLNVKTESDRIIHFHRDAKPVDLGRSFWPCESWEERQERFAEIRSRREGKGAEK
jgi:hypothetical protein